MLDNALESSQQWVGMEVCQQAQHLSIRIEDRGQGFSEEALEAFGKPYVSSKAGHGRGLGLFLVVNLSLIRMASNIPAQWA